MVEAAAAGLTADCPICNTTVTVPTPERAAKARAGSSKALEPAAPFADPSPDEIREELIDASMLNGKLHGDLTAARDEAARLQQQLKGLVEEHEHLNASATHAQRELKTFQSERQQLKSEAAALRQRVTALEELANGRAAEASKVASELESARQEIEGRGRNLAETGDLLDQTRKQLAAEVRTRETLRSQLTDATAQGASTAADLDGALGRLAQSETMLGEARGTVAGLKEERVGLQARLDDAGHRLTAAAELAKTLEATEAQLCTEREKVLAAEESNRALEGRYDDLSRESAVLRKDLGETHSGREMLDIRARLDEANAERERLIHRVEAVENDLRLANTSEETMRAERDEALLARDAARDEAAALRDSQTLKDNEVLRGIVSRLNAELAQRTGEVTRLKRAQYGLKIVYGIFGVGMLAVIAFALKVLPQFMR